MKLLETVLAFKLLDTARISESDRKFMINGMDYDKKDYMLSAKLR